ncbi:hypothetical protein TWF788_008010 [Orbilia oligospora]|uniref:Uncharacterized protein n=1 Tax=Orbilia oligospora TaxID=2813651 RepID=A0A7C8KHE5_ORBOL|nr:hypothetical protein TWF788_008010 [Orbilia oligospora]
MKFTNTTTLYDRYCGYDDYSLLENIYRGLAPEFGRGLPDIYVGITLLELIPIIKKSGAELRKEHHNPANINLLRPPNLHLSHTSSRDVQERDRFAMKSQKSTNAMEEIHFVPSPASTSALSLASALALALLALAPLLALALPLPLKLELPVPAITNI